MFSGSSAARLAITPEAQFDVMDMVCDIEARIDNRPCYTPVVPDDAVTWKGRREDVNLALTRALHERAAAYPALITPRALSSSVLYVVDPAARNVGSSRAAVIYVHGGGEGLGFGIAAAYAAQPVAGLTGVCTYAVDYRMAPDHAPWTGLEDIVEAYRFLLDQRCRKQIAIVSETSGACLAVAAVTSIGDAGLPPPAALLLHEPQAGRDPMRSADRLSKYAAWFPPTLVTMGSEEAPEFGAVAVHQGMRCAGVAADLLMAERAGDAPDARQALREAEARFVGRYLA